MNSFNLSDFEKFDKGSVKKVVDKIAINKSYQINFPAAFYKFNNLSGNAKALLYYNPKDSEIAIRFTKDNDRSGFKLNLSKNGDYGAYIGARSFLSSNKIDLDIYAGRYSYVKSEYDGNVYFVISLKEKGGNM